MFEGMIDLHCHYLPGIDDGVTELEEGIELCRGLRGIGFTKVIATPHIRTAFWENRPPGLWDAFNAFSLHAKSEDGLPELGLAAEHFFDDVFWSLFEKGEIMPYPGGQAALIEFSPELLPKAEPCLFIMQVRGLTPVIAHPERYTPLFKSSTPLTAMRSMEVRFLLDVMSLTGKYGATPMRAAERMLSEGLYFAACSDSHRPSDVTAVAAGIDRLIELVGEAGARNLLIDGPDRILSGRTHS